MASFSTAADIPASASAERRASSVSEWSVPAFQALKRARKSPVEAGFPEKTPANPTPRGISTEPTLGSDDCRWKRIAPP